MSDDNSDQEWARISRLRNKSIEENYSIHDIGTTLLNDRLHPLGYRLLEHGQNFGDHDDIYCGYGVDFEVRGQPFSHGERSDTNSRRLCGSEQTCGYVELKTKRSAEWMGRMNEKDWREYRGFAAYVDQPTVVAFALVDEDENTVAEWGFHRVDPWGNTVETLPFESKGHALVEIDDDDLETFPYLTANLLPP